MDGVNVFKAPRRRAGDLQTLPTYPWMFSWPLNASARLQQTNASYYNHYPCLSAPCTSPPYKANWQFRDHVADSRVNPDFLDMRGGPANIQNVVDHLPLPTPYPNMYRDTDLTTENKENSEHIRLERLDKRIWDEWLLQYGLKYFYLVPASEQ